MKFVLAGWPWFCLLSLAAAAAPPAAAPPAAAPTFSRDVAPMLYKHCLGCHRQGELAPMALDTYAHVRPYAKAIRDEIVDKTMPPWSADRSIGHFRNDPKLSTEETATLLAWVAAGAPQGSPRDLPQLPRFTRGFAMGKPDVELALPVAVAVPAQEEQRNRYFTVDAGFTEDRWVSGIEIKPDNRAIVHHITLSIDPPASRTLRTPPAMPCTDAFWEEQAIKRQREHPDTMTPGKRQYLFSWTPGSQPFWAQPGRARLVPAGSRLVFEVHYAPNGKAQTDRSRVGLWFAKDAKIEREVTTVVEVNEGLSIPPGEANHQAGACEVITRDVTLIALKAHMHLRGKDIRFELALPGQSREPLLYVPRWNFDWQFTYELTEPRALPAGTRIYVLAHYDNSAANRRNPDPTQQVTWSEQSTGEMLAGMLTFEETPVR